MLHFVHAVHSLLHLLPIVVHSGTSFEVVCSTSLMCIMGEAYCKDQFNKVSADKIVQHMEGARLWSTRRQRWNPEDHASCIHIVDRNLDRGGKAKASSFFQVHRP